MRYANEEKIMSHPRTRLLLSENKKAYIKMGKQFDSYQLSVTELRELCEYYQKKGIEIQISGETVLGQSLIQEKNRRYIAKIALLGKSDFKYAVYVTDCWGIDMQWRDGDNIGLHQGNATHINPLLLSWIENNLQDLSVADTEGLKIINNQLKDSGYVAELDKNIKKYRQILENKITYEGLLIDEFIKEGYALQKTLKPGEAVGLIYTAGYCAAKVHCEVMIITADSFIKPIVWPATAIPNAHIPLSAFENQYSTNLAIFCKLRFSPQTDGTACAALGMAYLKQLLKKDAVQLKQNTLRIPLYYLDPHCKDIKDKIALAHFFFPSPQTLQYSQSMLFNKVIVALLAEEDTVTLTHKGREMTISTLTKRLRDSIFSARLQRNNDVVTANEQTLRDLPAFRKRWLAEYRLIESKIEQMMSDEKNTTLTYTTKRYQAILDDMTLLGLLKAEEKSVVSSVTATLFSNHCQATAQQITSQCAPVHRYQS